jgi:hypothetical protein
MGLFVFFFLERAGELRIFILRRKGVKEPQQKQNQPAQTNSHTLGVACLKSYNYAAMLLLLYRYQLSQPLFRALFSSTGVKRNIARNLQNMSGLDLIGH